MKKLILIIFTLTMAIVSQAKILSFSPDVDVRVSQCEAFGNDVFVDLVITNTSESDIERFSIMGGADNSSFACDDDANQYTGQDFRVCIGKSKNFESTWRQSCPLPSETAVKVHIKLSNVPKSVTKILRLDLSCGVDYDVDKTIKITQIPISRK
ncbi:MAG: hypothetical protein NC548_49045 [Lachnospiraceae bacterium]|nr:hypothetical protein [Lachnospiraceae bacterium]